MVEVSIRCGEENSFDELLGLDGSGSGTVIETGFLHGDAVGEEKVGFITLESDVHVAEKTGPGSEERIALDDIAHIAGCELAGFVRQHASEGIARVTDAVGDLQRIECHAAEVLFRVFFSVDGGDWLAHGNISSGVSKEDEADEEKDQHDDHEAGVFADVFNHIENEVVEEMSPSS